MKIALFVIGLINVVSKTVFDFLTTITKESEDK